MKKFISLVLALSSIFSVMCTGANAETQTISYDSTQNSSAKSNVAVEVDCEIAEIYQVVLPKQVTLDGSVEAPVYDYTVNVTGEIGNGHYIRVIPLDGAKLSDGYVTIDLTVTQEKKRWNVSEATVGNEENSKTGSMTAGELTPGVWTGKVNFLVTLDDGAQWIPATCTSPATRVGVDANDDGIITEDEKDAVLVTKGVSLGHEIADNCTDFPAQCSRCNTAVYAINNLEQLESFKTTVNGGNKLSGATVYLNTDINMTGIEWTSGINDFQGNFDGMGHTISGLKMTNITGFFTRFSTGGYVKNVTFKDCIVVNSSGYDASTALVCGTTVHSRLFENVHVIGGTTNKDASTTYGSLKGGTAVLIGKLEMNYVTNSVVGIKNCSVIAHDMIYVGTGSALAPLVGYAEEVGSSEGSYVIQNSLAVMPAVMSNSACTMIDRIMCCAYDNIIIENCVMSKTALPAINNMNHDRTGYTNKGTYTWTNCLTGDTAVCQSQDAIDILNTDNDLEWSLDLEDINKGYPIIK